jgi:hypothetical protein
MRKTEAPPPGDEGAQAQAIRISGCSGRVEDFVNDVFVPLCGQSRNGAPLYKNSAKGRPDTYLVYGVFVEKKEGVSLPPLRGWMICYFGDEGHPMKTTDEGKAYENKQGVAAILPCETPKERPEWSQVSFSMQSQAP